MILKLDLELKLAFLFFCKEGWDGFILTFNHMHYLSGALFEQTRAWDHVVDMEHCQHHGGEGFTWYTKRQKWDHRSGGYSVICSLRRDDPLWRAIVKFFALV